MKVKNEAKIGFMITIVLVMLTVVTVKSGDFKVTKNGYTVKVNFLNVDGVTTNAPVMLNGLEVGTVKEINIVDEDQSTVMQLVVWLEDGAHVRKGSMAYVKNMGFLGEKYVGLTSGTPGAEILKPGSVIIGEEPADLDQLLMDGTEIADNIKQITENLNERLTKNEERIDNIILKMDTSMTHLASITENVDERLTINKEKIDTTLTNFSSTSANFDQFSYDLKMNPWKLLYRSKEKRMKNIKK